MDYLPKDPAILVSSVNMLLRDEDFDTLEALCYNFGTEPKDIKNYLYRHGFVYSEKQKQFRPIGYDKKESNHACMNCRVVSEEDSVNDNERQYRDSL